MLYAERMHALGMALLGFLAGSTLGFILAFTLGYLATVLGRVRPHRRVHLSAKEEGIMLCFANDPWWRRLYARLTFRPVYRDLHHYMTVRAGVSPAANLTNAQLLDKIPNQNKIVRDSKLSVRKAAARAAVAASEKTGREVDPRVKRLAESD